MPAVPDDVRVPTSRARAVFRETGRVMRKMGWQCPIVAAPSAIVSGVRLGLVAGVLAALGGALGWLTTCVLAGFATARRAERGVGR
ncbi:hypothetical protein Afil01_53880 [Actinorhabdospora filicis]|uniref:Uncharacterized protein n=1 Tax=Actinorhabdospora filicis TaxID=1785913 RepID=A0A9W6SQT4_9ACTN|nr:hypothetical protein Afil01_53880 [Actinorhabdospora filicis]